MQTEADPGAAVDGAPEAPIVTQVLVHRRAVRAHVALPWDDERAAIAELALGTATFGEFNRELYRFLSPIIGFDVACSAWTRDHDRPPSMAALGYSEALLAANFPRYMNELTTQELEQFTGARASVDLDVISLARRGALAVYRELLTPNGVSSFITNVWHCRAGVLGMHLGRTGNTRSLAGRPAEILQGLMPVIRLGMALLTNEATVGTEHVHNEWWASAWGLSAREHDTARMVARGFRNGEVAQMLRVSPNTIRNHLASIFRKAEVSTRAELLFAMSAEGPPSGAGGVHNQERARPWRDYVDARGTLGQRVDGQPTDEIGPHI